MTRGGVFGWDYPPGVTGNEPEIAGYPECPECGQHPDDRGHDEDGDPCTHPCHDEPDYPEQEEPDDG